MDPEEIKVALILLMPSSALTAFMFGIWKKSFEAGLALFFGYWMLFVTVLVFIAEVKAR